MPSNDDTDLGGCLLCLDRFYFLEDNPPFKEIEDYLPCFPQF
jgi:hypothetical protein